MREIITSLVTSPIVVADLTDANPNVYWELGVRQAFRHGTITIVEAGVTLPFDVGTKGTLFYHPQDHLRMEVFRTQFTAALGDCISKPERTDSHVLETLSGRGSIYEMVRRDEALRRLDALVAEFDDNIEQYQEIMKQASENLKTPSSRQVETNLFRLACSELLMTTRYLDATPGYYELLEGAFTLTAAINAQLVQWELSPEATEKWFLQDEKPDLQRLRTLRRQTKQHRDELLARSW